jgi:hypothetical protein
MKETFWLLVSDTGKIRTTRSRPDLKWNEVAVKVSIEIPNEMFQRPTVSAMIKIDKAPKVDIDATTINNIEEILKQQGINVKLTIEPIVE